MPPFQPRTQGADTSFSFLTQMPALRFGVPMAQNSPQLRLIRLDEINEEGHQAYRQALANVYASLDASQPVRLLYLLDGGPNGVHLYFGVVADDDIHLHEAMKNLRGALEGQLPGINFGAEISAPERKALLQRLNQSARLGVLLGTPTAQEPEQQGSHNEQNFQDIDRLVRAMQSGSSKTDVWQLAIVSQPLTQQHIYQQLDAAYALSSQLALDINTNVQLGDNSSRQTGTSTGFSTSHGSNSGTSKTSGDNRSLTKSNNTSDTTGDNASDTSGKSEGGSESRSSGQNKNHGTSTSHTKGTSNSRTTGTSDSKTVGSSTSDTRSEGLSLTRSTNEGRSHSDTSGQSLNVSKEFTDKRMQHLVDYLDKQLIARLQKGLTKGLFHSAVYLAADNASLYQRLKHTVRATFQGDETTLAPLQVHDLPPEQASADGQLLRLPVLTTSLAPDELLFRSLHADPRRSLGSLMTADELAIVASLPQHELQGIRRRRSVEFIVDLPEVEQDKAPLRLGAVIDRGRRYPNNHVNLAARDLNIDPAGIIHEAA